MHCGAMRDCSESNITAGSYFFGTQVLKFGIDYFPEMGMRIADLLSFLAARGNCFDLCLGVLGKKPHQFPASISGASDYSYVHVIPKCWGK